MSNSAYACRNTSIFSSTLNILLVDHHTIVRAALSEILKAQHNVNIVGQASSGEQAVEMARQLNPDIILMELNMPGIGGLEATQRIMHINDSFKIIALTSCTDEPYPSRFIKLGGMGYLTKNTTVDELITAIHAVDEGKPYLMPDIAQKLAMSQITGKDQSPLEKLSERELQVLLMITQGNRVNQIAEKLFLSPKTINTYRYRIYEKLGINNDVDLTHLALRYGMLTQQDTAAHTA